MQKLAELRLEDARILLQQGRYAAAYYLCGYAIECGLKACIAKQINQYEYPPYANFSRDLFTHDLRDLVKHAELTASLTARISASRQFGLNWESVAKWSEQSRYDTWTRQEAEELVDAVSSIPDGVLEWIRQRW